MSISVTQPVQILTKSGHPTLRAFVIGSYRAVGDASGGTYTIIFKWQQSDPDTAFVLDKIFQYPTGTVTPGAMQITRTINGFESIGGIGGGPFPLNTVNIQGDWSQSLTDNTAIQLPLYCGVSKIAEPDITFVFTVNCAAAGYANAYFQGRLIKRVF